MKRNAFLDPVTSRLKCHGFVLTNEVGDITMEVPEDFPLEPSDGWKWDGSTFVSFPFPSPPDRKARAREVISKVPAGPQREAFDSLLEII